jgi:hypothetical protein
MCGMFGFWKGNLSERKGVLKEKVECGSGEF